MTGIEWQSDYDGLRQQQSQFLSTQLASVWTRSEFYMRRWGAAPEVARFTELPLIRKSDLHAALDDGGFMGSNLACSLPHPAKVDVQRYGSVELTKIADPVADTPEQHWKVRLAHHSTITFQLRRSQESNSQFFEWRTGGR